ASAFGDAHLLPGSAGAHGVALACRPDRCLAAFSRESDGHGVVTVVTLDPTQTEARPLSAIQPVTASGALAIAWAGSQFAVGWPGADATGGSHVYATAFGTSGERLSEPRALGVGAQ